MFNLFTTPFFILQHLAIQHSARHRLGACDSQIQPQEHRLLQAVQRQSSTITAGEPEEMAERPGRRDRR